MGILPRGSGNGLAKHLAIPKSIRKALIRYLQKRIQIIDAITINDEWSFNVAGIGFDGYISALFGKDGKRGMRNYIKLVQKEYARYTPINMEIRLGTKSISTSLLQLAVANASQYGNNAFIAPNASLQDHMLDIAMIKKIPLALLPAFFVKLFSGRVHRSAYYSGFRANDLKVNTSRPVHFHTDGDGKGIDDKFEIKLVPGCLRILY
jgi:diacylglycerol kinase (ATP)